MALGGSVGSRKSEVGSRPAIGLDSTPNSMLNTQHQVCTCSAQRKAFRQTTKNPQTLSRRGLMIRNRISVHLIPLSCSKALAKDLGSANLIVDLVAQIWIKLQSLSQLPEVLSFAIGIEVNRSQRQSVDLLLKSLRN